MWRRVRAPPAARPAPSPGAPSPSCPPPTFLPHGRPHPAVPLLQGQRLVAPVHALLAVWHGHVFLLIHAVRLHSAIAGVAAVAAHQLCDARRRGAHPCARRPTCRPPSHIPPLPRLLPTTTTTWPHHHHADHAPCCASLPCMWASSCSSSAGCSRQYSSPPTCPTHQTTTTAATGARAGPRRRAGRAASDQARAAGSCLSAVRSFPRPAQAAPPATGSQPVPLPRPACPPPRPLFTPQVWARLFLGVQPAAVEPPDQGHHRPRRRSVKQVRPPPCLSTPSSPLASLLVRVGSRPAAGWRGKAVRRAALPGVLRARAPT